MANIQAPGIAPALFCFQKKPDALFNRHFLQLCHPALDDIEPTLPECCLVDIDAGIVQQLFWCKRTACTQDLFVARFE